jgi:hypothetical protein
VRCRTRSLLESYSAYRSGKAKPTAALISIRLQYIPRLTEELQPLDCQALGLLKAQPKELFYPSPTREGCIPTPINLHF